MERLGSVGFGSVLLVCLMMSVSAFEMKYRLRQLCKGCDIESTTCNPTGICESSCDITYICEDLVEVCVSAWRRSEGNTTVETMCHNPALPFYGQNLTDYNSSRCVMKRVEDDFYICSCNKEECNDRLIFTDDAGLVSPGDDLKNLLSLLLVILLLSVAVVVPLITLFYFFYVCRQHKKSNQ
ncbi:TGF-beta receptor type-2-like [Pseudorasbora parva]|uniref:TGF-beta receptor type-2-like n=1 Tax=Pseudorasbora parva TaxID=51549 RepID=UPI00351F25AC